MHDKRRTIAGLVLFAVVAMVSAALLRASTDVRDLEVRLESPHAFVLFDSTEEIRGAVDPPRLRDRVRARIDRTPVEVTIDEETGSFSLPVPRTSPGIHWLSWNVQYGGRWDRDVALGYVEGPFNSVGSSHCGAFVSISQSLLDDGDPLGGDDLVTSLQPYVREIVESQIQQEEHLRGHSIRKVELGIDIVERKTRHGETLPGVNLRIKVQFQRIGGFTVRLSVVLMAEHQRILAKSFTKPEIEFDGRFKKFVKQKGRSKGGLVGALLGGLLFGPAGLVVGGVGGAAYGEDKAMGMAIDTLSDAVVPAALEAIGGLFKPRHFAIQGKHGEIDVTVAPCGLIKSSTGEFLEVGLTVALPTRPSRSIEGLAGAVVLPVGTWTAQRKRRDVEIAVSPNIINILTYHLWQTGTLRSWASDPERIRCLNDSLDMLDVSLRGIDPVLPPVLQPNSGSERYELRVAEFQLNTEDDRSPMLFGSVAIEPRGAPDGKGIQIGVDLQELLFTCHSKRDQSLRDPCFSDLSRLMQQSLNAPESGIQSNNQKNTDSKAKAASCSNDLMGVAETSSTGFSARALPAIDFRVVDFLERFRPGTAGWPLEWALDRVDAGYVNTADGLPWIRLGTDLSLSAR